MIAIGSIRWRGSPEELAELDKLYKKCADNVDGCKYMGRYSSWQTDYNWAYFFEVEDMSKFEKAMMSEEFNRDYNKFPAFVVEFFSGPY